MAGSFGEEEGAQIGLIGELKVAMGEQKKTIVREFFFSMLMAHLYTGSALLPRMCALRDRG